MQDMAPSGQETAQPGREKSIPINILSDNLQVNCVRFRVMDEMFRVGTDK